MKRNLEERENKYRGNGDYSKILGICTDTIKRDGKPILGKNGEKLYGAIGWYRIINPLVKLKATIEMGPGLKATAEDALGWKKKGDVWFTKMMDNENVDHLIRTHADFTGAKIVLDLDDDPNNVSPDHPEIKELENRYHMWDRMIKSADHVVVSTEQIRQSIKHQNPYITVIPNAIDPEIWKVKRKRRTDGKIRIGWIASGSHFVDSPIIEDIMQELIEEYPNVEFHLAGMINQEARGKGWIHHKGTDGYKPFPQFYADLDLDIAIAPLKDNPFNQAKSNIKFLEASMLGIPTVASDVKPYQCIQHGKTGYLASTPGQFKKYLKWLIEDETKRKEMGKEAKKYVLENWTIDKFLPMYDDLFQKLTDKKDIAVVTAITGGKDNLLPQPEYRGVEYVAFTDKEVKDSQWKVRKACQKFVNPVMNAKIYKILTHKYVDTPYIVWMDGNCSLKQDPHELVKLMGNKDFAFFKHPGWDSVYREAERCVELGKGDVSEIAEQVRVYAKESFPDKSPHCEMTCFIRKNNKKTNDLFEKWWIEVTRYSERDQISFPVVFKGQKWATIPGSVVKAKDFNLEDKNFPGNDYFNYKKHNK
jgi:glycosyltransferase involved in cell wall biosynthesis